MKLPEIAIFGYNNVGIDVALHLLERGQTFIVADRDEKKVQKAAEDGYGAVLVDLTDDNTLITAGVGANLTTIFCLFPEDAQNVFLVISARALDPRLNIVSVCTTEDAEKKLVAAGANKVINPYQISGRKIYEIIRKPEIVELLDNVVFGRQDLHIVELVIEPGSALEGGNIEEIRIDGEFNLILLGMENREKGTEIRFATSGISQKLEAGDKLVVIGPSREITRFRDSHTRHRESNPLD